MPADRDTHHCTGADFPECSHCERARLADRLVRGRGFSSRVVWVQAHEVAGPHGICPRHLSDTKTRVDGGSVGATIGSSS